MNYTFVIKIETFDQDMRELCHQLNVENKETCYGLKIITLNKLDSQQWSNLKVKICLLEKKQEIFFRYYDAILLVR